MKPQKLNWSTHSNPFRNIGRLSDFERLSLDCSLIIVRTVVGIIGRPTDRHQQDRPFGNLVECRSFQPHEVEPSAVLDLFRILVGGQVCVGFGLAKYIGIMHELFNIWLESK